MTNGLRRLKQLVPRRRKSAGGAAVYHRRADAAEFVERLQHAKVVPHIAQNTSNRRSAVPDAIAKGPRYAVSQLARKRIEEIFGWAKEIGGMAQTRLRGTATVDWRLSMTLAAYNLVRMHKLMAT
jgi:hypothetical protein